MTNGVKLYQEQNLDAAVAEFEAAYKAKPKASPLVNIALCYKGQFKYPQAIQALEKALAQHADSMSAADKRAAEDAIKDLRGLLGFVTLKLTPPTAIVSVDGDDLPKDAGSKPIPLGPGNHKLRARADGYADVEKEVSVSSGDTGKVVEMTLRPDKGWVSITAKDPSHAIAIDQKAVGYGSWTGFLSPGTHLVQIYEIGSPSAYSQQIVVAAGKVLEVKEGERGAAAAFFPPPEGIEKPEPDKPPPVFQGFYGLGTVGFYGTVGELSGDIGYAIGARVGWRPSTVVGVEGMFQFGHSEQGGAIESTVVDNRPVDRQRPGSEMDSVRIGGNLRLMTRGRVARFVGTLGAGLAIDSIDFIEGECDSAPAEAGSPETLCFETDNSGVGAYGNAEFGMEFDFSGMFFGVALQQMLSSVGLDGPELGDAQLHVGLHLRLGYGTW